MCRGWGEVVSGNVAIVNKLGGFEVARLVGELRGRIFTQSTVTTGVASTFGDDFDHLYMVAKGDLQWLLQPKPATEAAEKAAQEA